MGFEAFWTRDTTKKSDIKQGLADYFSGQTEETDSAEDQYSHEQTPTGLVATADIFSKDSITLEEIHDWYVAAITRRGRTALGKERFVAHFNDMSTEPTYAYGEPGNGYLLGYLKFGVFVPTHFAPKTLRGGYMLMSQLGESKHIPSVLAVTQDLTETLAKMPSWHLIDLGFLAVFRSELTEKQILHNSHPDVKNLMLGLVTEYLQESKQAAHPPQE